MMIVVPPGMGLGALRLLAWAAPGSRRDEPRARPAAPAAVVPRNWRRDRARFLAENGNDLRNMVILLRNRARITVRHSSLCRGVVRRAIPPGQTLLSGHEDRRDQFFT